MGSIPSLPWLQTRQNRQTPFLQAQYPAEHLQQAQCPAENVHQAQNIVRPGRQERILTRGHKIKGHHLVTNVELTIVKEYQTELSYIKHICKVTDSLYCVISSKLRSVHVMKNGRVIVGGYRAIDILDKNGLHLKRHKLDKNGKPLFNGNIISLTSTNFGNIFMVEGYPTHKVVMFMGSCRF